MADPTTTLRMRAQGARETAQQVAGVGGAVKGVATAAAGAARESTLLQKTGNSLLAPFRHIRTEATSLAKSVIGLGLAYGTVSGLHKAVDNTEKLVDTTLRLRRAFGFSTEAASGLAAVLDARQLNTSVLTQGLQQLSRQTLAAYHGSSQATYSFGLLGVGADRLRTVLGSRDGLSNLFTDVVDKLSKMPGGATRAAIASQLLGRTARTLSPLFREGALGLRDQLKYAKEYGITLSGTTVGALEDMRVAQLKAQYASLGLQIQLGTLLAPALAKVNVEFATIVKSFRDGRPEGDQFARTVENLGNGLKPVLHLLEGTAKYLGAHPALLKASAGAWIAWKLGLLKIITIGPAAYLKGLLAGRAYGAGFATGSQQLIIPGLERTAEGPGILAAGRAIGMRLATGAVLVLDAYLGKKLWNDFFGKGDHSPVFGLESAASRGPHTPGRGIRGMRGGAGDIVGYFRAHPRELDVGTYESLTPGQRNALGVTLAHNAAGGAIVIHVHTHLDSRPIAESVHRVAVKKKSTR